ncbi:FAD-binding oxidoreductase [Aureimonas sp. Leaf324]|jgi:FAD/FMN-containing dehydrogenase|uniref:FAD-binding oxidoreductase n=1 Tax=Aureimonas sp. Leaf324 TaxID=1736336 RepID=UPI0006F7A8F1|nr:FAD-binding oxidoreductase [Aureimonas sp. Leaf324]KQQ88205.1 FAD-linked oxidase [Aureimonas sp. Leaf324]
MPELYENWGRMPPPPEGRRSVQAPQADVFPAVWDAAGLLPRGNGRSYGDTCLNEAGVLVDMRGRNRILSLDLQDGVIEAEAGVLLHHITERIAPHGWFLPVTPGTQFVTLGGALANDVHGKNHHRRGTFGAWVESFTLTRSDLGTLVCSRSQNADIFAATIGGMGLTGIVTRIRLRLLAVPSLTIRETTHRLSCLDDYFARAAEADERHEYAVAWIDQLARGARFGRGHLICGDHAGKGDHTGRARRPLFSVPFTPPVSPLRGLALKAFNELNFRKLRRAEVTRNVPFDGFFYPLDRIGGWNRLYGPQGLHQHQSVVPEEMGRQAARALMECAVAHGQGSFLTVLKRFGDLPSPGLLSFPRRGYTLTLDFPNRGPSTLALMDELDRITIEAGGAVNPYKDARMAPEVFAASFPRWRRLEAMRDPAIVSDFWRRTALRLDAGRQRYGAAA